jgi:hypothetical protein
VKNDGVADLINLPAFNPAPPKKINWGYNPGTNLTETNRVVRFIEKLKKETNICSDDIIRAFISRRVLPLKRRTHKMSEMYGPGDPTKITGLPLSKKDVVLKARQICQTAMPFDWEWGFLPLSSTNPPTKEVRTCATWVLVPVTFLLRLTCLLFVFRPRSASPASTRIDEALARSALWTGRILTPTSIGTI